MICKHQKKNKICTVFVVRARAGKRMQRDLGITGGTSTAEGA